MQVGWSAVKAPWIMPHQPVVDGHRCSRVSGLPAHHDWQWWPV